MPDAIDKSVADQEADLKRHIDAARHIIQNKPGPRICMKCGELNNQAAAGLAICSDCVGEE